MVQRPVVGGRQTDEQIHRGRLPGVIGIRCQKFVGYPEEGEQEEGLILALVPPVGQSVFS